MNRLPTSLMLAGIAMCLMHPATVHSKVRFNGKFPQVAFAAQELNTVLAEVGREDLQVMLVVKPDDSSPEAFRIWRVAANDIRVIGTDETGTMYGGLEVAELLRMGLPVSDQQQKPFVRKRGIKWNIPLDARIPSYDDSGDAAQKNIETVWDFEFWKAYIDDLARYRYNVLSLWATHPFPCLIQLDEYPDVALDDVYRMSDGVLKPDTRNKWQGIDLEAPGVLELVKKLPIEEKIKHWQRVFEYAEDRGIEIYVFCWNVFTWYADGKYGITQEQDNPRTIEYIRKCVRELLTNYPQIAGIGVTAGENADWYLEDENQIEKWIFNTYGKAIMEVRQEQPEREIRFIFRRHVTEHPDVTAAFKEYTGGIIDTSIKYSVAHTFSSRRPQEWETRIVDEGWLENYKAWLNLRNDDIFMHRWGSADYVRDFIKWMPHEHMRGFYMGSDGYVWAREFIAKNPEMAGRLEIDKHWYQFRLWGQLAYNIDLDRNYWEAALRHRFPGVDATLLYDAWASTSEIIPQLNRASWSPTDAAFSAEGCVQGGGFLTIEEYYFNRPTMFLRRIENPPDPQCISVTDWAKAVLSGKTVDGVTPLQVSDNLDGWADYSLEALPALRDQAGNNVELMETLNDIESMAYLGRYYADKLRGAAMLALFREGGRKDQKYIDRAVAHLEEAVKEWKSYAGVLTPQYKTSLLARTHTLDWNATLKDVEKEVITIMNEGDIPTVRFINIKNGDRFPAGKDLGIEVEAIDGHGIKDIQLYMNGRILEPESQQKNSWMWTASADDLLKHMQSGRYHLDVQVVDNTGVKNREQIDITIGDAAVAASSNWENEIFSDVLSEGERLNLDEIKQFPRLQCYLTINEEGSLLLMRGLPGESNGFIWKTRGKADRPTPQPVPPHFYATMKDGQMQVWRSYPGKPKVLLYETRKPTDKGDYKLGITASRRLVVYREGDGAEIKTHWMTPIPD